MTPTQPSTTPQIINAKFLASYPKWSLSTLEPLPQVCFAGRSNVGKSSLINSLVGQNGLAKTSSTPGRTRELVVFQADLRTESKDIPFHFVDLPGYGYAKVPVKVKESWMPMVKKYFEGNQQLVCCIFLLDIRRRPQDWDFDLMDMMEQCEIPVLPVVTKIDKIPKTQRVRELKKIAEGFELDDWRDLRPVSAKDNSGLKELLQDMGMILSETSSI